MEPEHNSATKEDLPEDILCHILSFLPTLDAIRGSFVSPDWCNLWHVLPTLHFDIHHFRDEFQIYSADEICQLFAEFVCQTLFLRRPLHSPLHKLHLSFHYLGFHRHKSHVDSWVRYAVKYKATELDLNLRDSVFECMEAIDIDDNDCYQFHFAELINSSVQVLKLTGCDICLPTTTKSLPIKISSLKSIYMYGPMFFQQEEGISDMVNLCVNLEFLSIEGVVFSNNLTLVSPKLKVLILSDFKGMGVPSFYMAISAPNLRVFRCFSFYMGKYFLSHAHSLVEASIIFDNRHHWDFCWWTNAVKLVAGVEHLTIQNMWVLFEFEHMEGHPIDYNAEDHKEFEPDDDYADFYGKENIIFREGKQAYVPTTV